LGQTIVNIKGESERVLRAIDKENR